MTSAELNERIAQFDNEDKTELMGTWHGKPVPYIGWFWRAVEFDTPPYTLGVIPGQSMEDRGGVYYVGFMENNKWAYPEFDLEPGQSQELRARLEQFVKEPTMAEQKELSEYMQSLAPDWTKND